MLEESAISDDVINSVCHVGLSFFHYSIVCCFIPLLHCSMIMQSFIHSFIILPSIKAVIPSIHASSHQFIHVCCHACIHSSTHPFLQPFITPLLQTFINMKRKVLLLVNCLMRMVRLDY